MNIVFTPLMTGTLGWQDFSPLAFISGMPGWTELLVVAVIGLLIFGKRLPEVGKSLGKSIVEFKKGLRGIEDDLNKAVEQDQSEMLPPPEQQSTQQTQSENQKQQQPAEETSSQNNSSQNP
jgi:sec-independent protein translocase protein TatA